MSTTSEIADGLRNGVLYDDDGEVLRVATKALMRVAADHLVELERENARLREIARLAQECADDLEAEVKSRWVDPDGSIHPALQRKFDRDMSIVIELRAALAGSGEK
jgi:hypothetical protein